MACPGSATSTSTRTAISTACSPTIATTGSSSSTRRPGWTRKVMAGKAGEPGALPKIVRNGTNNGFFVHSRHLWWQNEDTAKLPDHVDRRSFDDLVKDVPRQAKSPQAALRSLRTAPGFKVELVACEPLVQDPIAMDWGADGKLWVVEMGDYPLGVDGKGKPGGVVRFLEDLDGDGRYDKATTFLDGLPFPTGVMPWRDGVLVASAPEIFFAEDRDGDGKADHREVLFTGFGEGNQQHRLNGFELGLDGWVYGANGDSGGTVRSLKTGKTVNIQGRDFRFRPDTGEFEAESGQTQYGRHRDDWGNWFGNSNPTWGWHFVLSRGGPEAEPVLRPARPEARRSSRDTRLYPASRTLARFNDPECGQPRHLGEQPDALPRRPLRPALRDQPVRQRAGAQPGAPDGPGARRGDVSRRQGPGGSRPRVPRLDRQLVPADPAQDRTRRRPLGRGHVSRRDRAPGMDPGGRPEDGSTSAPGARRGESTGSSPSIAGRGRFPGSIGSTPRAWWRPSTARTAGSATRPCGCCMHRDDRSAVEPLRRLARTSGRPQARVEAICRARRAARARRGDGAGGPRRPASPGSPDRDQGFRGPDQGCAPARPGRAPAGGRSRPARPAAARHVAGRVERSAGGPGAGEPAAGRSGRPLDPGRRPQLGGPPRGDAAGGAGSRRPGGTACAVIEPLVSLAGSIQDPAVMETVVRAVLEPAGQGGGHAPWQFAAVRGLLEASGRSKHPIGARPREGAERAARRGPQRWPATTAAAGVGQDPRDQCPAVLRGRSGG